ncbi:MAG: SDR family oxidoreductase [Bacteroidota bacterium]|nr:SDR family oxidoreductase [Bacteroidota bacterium]
MSKDIFQLKDKVVLVTGGGTGLGFAISTCFIEQGAKVIISGRREEVLLKACEKLGSSASYVSNDLANLDQIPAFVEKVKKIYGRIDVLVNNAGLHLKKDLLEVTDEEFSEIIQVNQMAVFSLSREVAKLMKDKGQGVIIMISSMASQYGIPKVIAYSAAKSAIEGMTRAMSVELSPFGIRINCIAPGFIKTKMSAGALDNDPGRKAKVLGRTPLGKLGDPVDIGHAAVFLASDAAEFITGVVLPVDGGNSIGF